MDYEPDLAAYVRYHSVYRRATLFWNNQEMIILFKWGLYTIRSNIVHIVGSRVSTTLQISSILLLKNSILLSKLDPTLSTDSRSPDTTNASLAGFTMLSNQEITLPLETPAEGSLSVLKWLLSTCVAHSASVLNFNRLYWPSSLCMLFDTGLLLSEQSAHRQG